MNTENPYSVTEQTGNFSVIKELERKTSCQTGIALCSIISVAAGEVARSMITQTDIDPIYCLYLASLGLIAGISVSRVVVTNNLLVNIQQSSPEEIIKYAKGLTFQINQLRQAKEKGENYDTVYLDYLIEERREANFKILQ